MEQTLPYLWDAFNANIDWVIVILVIASGYFQSAYLKDLNFADALKTLFVSFVSRRFNKQGIFGKVLF
jgi:hypothetical protein